MVLQVIYPNCCGIDVHKTFVFACIAITDNKGIPSYYRKRFSTFTHGLRDLAEWLEYYSCFDVCMESTGKYWILDYSPRYLGHEIASGRSESNVWSVANTD